jgi:hypothetical protein
MIEKPIPREENLGSPSKPIPKRDINCETNITEPLARSMIPRARMAMDRFEGHSNAAAITKGKTEQIAGRFSAEPARHTSMEQER